MKNYNYLSAREQQYTKLIISFAKQSNENDFRNAKTITEEFNCSTNMIIRDIKGMRIVLQLRTR